VNLITKVSQITHQFLYEPKLEGEVMAFDNLLHVNSECCFYITKPETLIIPKSIEHLIPINEFHFTKPLIVIAIIQSISIKYTKLVEIF
jgi:hypothetical protein